MMPAHGDMVDLLLIAGYGIKKLPVPPLKQGGTGLKPKGMIL